MRRRGALHWLDAYGTNFDAFVNITLPDKDVFAIDATATPPVAVGSVYAHVGTTLFNMAVNPSDGKVYVTNTDAHNDVRFEGHNAGLHDGARPHRRQPHHRHRPGDGHGHAANLNPHIDSRGRQRRRSDAEPRLPAGHRRLARTARRSTSSRRARRKLAIYDTAALEAGNAAPTRRQPGAALGGRPDRRRRRRQRQAAPSCSRASTTASRSSTSTKQRESRHTSRCTTPSRRASSRGRQFLYDATLPRQHGDQACASCHIGGDFDGLAWDLGNPGGSRCRSRTARRGVRRRMLFTIPPSVGARCPARRRAVRRRTSRSRVR